MQDQDFGEQGHFSARWLLGWFTYCAAYLWSVGGRACVVSACEAGRLVDRWGNVPSS